MELPTVAVRPSIGAVQHPVLPQLEEAKD